MVKIFKEITNNSITDNLIINSDNENPELISIRVTCGRDGHLAFTKKQVLHIADYLNKIAKE